MTSWRRLTVLLVAAAVAASACVNKSDISALATSSTQGADTLGTLYSVLLQVSRDALTVRAAAGTLGVTNAIDEAAQAAYERSIGELDRRAQMAAALGGVYRSLNSLAGSQAPEDTAMAASKAAAALWTVGVIKGGASNPQEELGPLAKALSDWKAGQDIQRALEAAAPSAGRIETFFRMEIPTYKSITHDASEALKTLRIKLVDDGFVAPESLLQMLTDPYGLRLSSPTCPRETPDCLKDLAKRLIELRATRLEYVLNGAIQAMDQTLQALSDGYKSFLGGGSPHTDLIGQYRERTEAYLREAGQLRPMTPPLGSTR